MEDEGAPTEPRPADLPDGAFGNVWQSQSSMQVRATLPLRLRLTLVLRLRLPRLPIREPRRLPTPAPCAPVDLGAFFHDLHYVNSVRAH